VLAGPSLRQLLGTVLGTQGCGRIHLSPGLVPHWARRIEDRGGCPVPLSAAALHDADGLRELLAGSRAGEQLWLDLGDPVGAGEDALAQCLALAAGAPGLQVVLLRDDAPARARTQRLAVDRPGRVLLLRESAGTAYVLGAPERLRELAGAADWAPGPGPVPRAGSGTLLVLDVDGVLIDPGRAFMEAVAGALGDLAPELAWGEDDYLALKRAGGFNNDFRLAAAALALGETGGLPFLGAPGVLERVEDRIRDWEPRCQEAVRAHYAQTRLLERPLVSREQLSAAPGDLALFTGRPPEELGFAFEVLGFTLPAVGDRAAHLRKPRPEGLIQLADAFRAGRITFVGDSPDDAAALRAARVLRPDLDWRFAAVGDEGARFALDGDLRADSLLGLLASGDLA